MTRTPFDGDSGGDGIAEDFDSSRTECDMTPLFKIMGEHDGFMGFTGSGQVLCNTGYKGFV